MTLVERLFERTDGDDLDASDWGLLHEAADAIGTLQARVTALELERDEARQFGENAARQYNELLAWVNIVTCAYCGKEYPRGTPRHGDGLLAEHIKTCEKHPMRQAESALARHIEQAHAISHLLEGTGVGPCPLAEGVRVLIVKLTQAQAERDALKAPYPIDREFLGRLVRMVWVAWAKEQPDSPPHHLISWEELSEPSREVDRRIGEKVAEVACAILERERRRLDNALTTANALGARLADRMSHYSGCMMGWGKPATCTCGYNDDQTAARAAGWLKEAE